MLPLFSGARVFQQTPTQMYPTPRRGDVLFTNGCNPVEAIISVLAQQLVDPLAKGENAGFGHVAIALDNFHAFEAMPESKDKKSVRSDGRLKQVARWSGVKLEFGARLVPLPDIFIPNRSRLTVLRAPETVELSEQAFEITSPFISSLVGSEYSIEALRNSAERILRIVSPYIIRVLAKGSSAPHDLAHEVAIDEELKARMTVPSYAFPFESRTFFCSQLVIDVLKKANQSFTDQLPEKTTPTGLYRLLRKLGWKDVTESDYGASSIQNYNRSTRRAACRANYMESQAMLIINRELLASQESIKFIGETFNKLNAFCEETTQRLLSRL
jgi:hypothetical protein